MREDHEHPSDGAVLALRDISKSFGSRRVLDGITVDVQPGEILGYVGSNGAGKTTSMRVILGITEADSGEVSLGGDLIDDEVRSRIGYMPEERGLYPTMRVKHQLRFFAELRGVARSQSAACVAYWLERLGLADRRDHRLEELSLGNQQRVQLAAALVHEPRALVLDEPFSGLDPLAVNVMAEVLREEAARGVPVIFSSHQLELVEQLCDRVAILRSGQIVAHNDVASLTDDDGSRYILRSTMECPDLLAALEQELGRTDVMDHLVDSSSLGHAAVLRLDPSELQHAVDVVRRQDDLLELAPWRRSLSEVYHDVVDSSPDPLPAVHSTQEVQL